MILTSAIIALIGFIVVIAGIVMMVRNSPLGNFMRPQFPAFSDNAAPTFWTLALFIFTFGALLSVERMMFPRGFTEVFGGINMWYILFFWVFISFVAALGYITREQVFGRVLFGIFLSLSIGTTLFVLMAPPAMHYSPEMVDSVNEKVTRIKVPAAVRSYTDSVNYKMVYSISEEVRLDGDSASIFFSGSGASFINIIDDCDKVHQYFRQGDARMPRYSIPSLKVCNEGEKPIVRFQCVGEGGPEEITIKQSYVTHRKNMSHSMARWWKSFF